MNSPTPGPSVAKPAGRKVLQGWLERADDHYVGGRALLRTGPAISGGVLGWLAFEQLAKLLIIIHRIGQLDTKMKAGEMAASSIDTLARSIDSSHKSAPLIAALKQELGVQLEAAADIIEHLEDAFQHRYYRQQPYSFSAKQVQQLDQLYFDLRDSCHLRLGSA